MMAFALATIMNAGSYWFSDKIVLRIYNAQPVTESQAPELYSMVRTLVQKAEMPSQKFILSPMRHRMPLLQVGTPSMRLLLLRRES